MSELLSEGSRLFPSSSSTASNPAVNASRSAAIRQATVNKTLRRAEEMLREGTSTGLSVGNRTDKNSLERSAKSVDRPAKLFLGTRLVDYGVKRKREESGQKREERKVTPQPSPHSPHGQFTPRRFLLGPSRRGQAKGQKLKFANP